MSLKFRNIFVLSAGVVLGVTLTVAGGVFADRATGSKSLPWEEARLLAEVLERVRQEYVESVDDHTLMESAVRGMVTDLDPHSQFLDVDEYEEIRISTTGNYSGVGLEVNIRDEAVTVVAPIDGTPAARAGLRTGDIILSIDGTPVDNDSIDDTVNRMRGKPGSTVSITVRRISAEEPIEFNLVRSQVHVRSVRSEILEPGYGYIRLTHFSETTYSDLRKAVKNIQDVSSGPLAGLVIDLRNNPGGVLDAAVDVSDAFLDDGVIVTASGRGPDANFSHTARPGDLLNGAGIVIMVNEGSASASEIVAGALQTHRRATVVGSRTFGKGSVQTVMPLSNGRAIKLTTSRYYTPSGESIHGKGITPDIDLEEREMADFMAGVGEVRTDAGAAMLQADSQLRETLDILKGGRVVQSKAD